MANLTMDLTGTLSNYADADKVFKIFKYDQYVDIEAVIFSDTLKVYLLSGTIVTELVKDVDYVIPASAVTACDNDKSNAKLIDNTFDRELISGIQMIRGVDETDTYTISLSYQRLYPNQLRTAYYHNEPLNLTPELVLDMVQNIENLKTLTSRVTNFGDLTTDSSILLEVDETETNDNNIIEDEVHLLNVSGGRFIIHPKCGAFYSDSVVVKHPSSGATLVRGTDYLIVGMDEARTKASSSIYPVYQFILVTAPISDEVTVSYHAYGGEPTIDNYKQILTSVNNVIQYLNDSKTLTETSLGKTEVMTSLYERISKLEESMRRLQGTPSYGDITSGKCILMKLFSETPGLHWYTIASLYKTTGIEVKPCTADTFVFRLQSQLSHFQFHAAASVDLSNTTGDRFNVNVIADNYPRGYTPFDDYSNVTKIIKPQLRVVWVENDTVSGAYLQLGFELKGMLEETISIEDMSGSESCWKLVDEVATVTTPTDDDFILPDESTTWSTLLENAYSESMLVPFNKGHLIWSGTQTMNRPDAGWQCFTASGDSLYLDSTTNIKKITRIRLDIEEKNGLQFPVDISLNSGTEHLKGHASFTHQNKPVYVNAEIYREGDNIVVRINYEVTAGLESNELDMRDIVIFC